MQDIVRGHDPESKDGFGSCPLVRGHDPESKDGFGSCPRPGDEVVPTFPNAKYYVQEKEWQMAVRPDVRSKASYREANFAVLDRAGQLVLVNGDQEQSPGISVVRTGGHTPGHQVVIVRPDDCRLQITDCRLLNDKRPAPGSKPKPATAVFWGDLIPTASHINVPYVMGYDTMPLETMEWKEKLLKQALAEQWLMFFEHDPEIVCGYLSEEEGRYTVQDKSQVPSPKSQASPKPKVPSRSAEG